MSIDSLFKSRNLCDAFRDNTVHQTFDGSLADGIELIMRKKQTISLVAPTLIILLRNGAKWDRDDLLMPGRRTPYHVICHSKGDYQELLELMIKELGRSLLNAKDDDGCTALMYAVLNANIKCVKCLIASGADVNLINDNPNDIGIMNGPLFDSLRLMRPPRFAHIKPRWIFWISYWPAEQM